MIIIGFYKQQSSKSKVLEVYAIARVEPGRCRSAPVEEGRGLGMESMV